MAVMVLLSFNQSIMPANLFNVFLLDAWKVLEWDSDGRFRFSYNMGVNRQYVKGQV